MRKVYATAGHTIRAFQSDLVSNILPHYGIKLESKQYKLWKVTIPPKTESSFAALLSAEMVKKTSKDASSNPQAKKTTGKQEETKGQDRNQKPDFGTLFPNLATHMKLDDVVDTLGEGVVMVIEMLGGNAGLERLWCGGGSEREGLRPCFLSQVANNISRS